MARRNETLTKNIAVGQVSMMQREREERLEGKMVFWGKVEGNENDYLVCYALATPTLEEGDFPLKKARIPCSVE
ncbi:unnamed protein product [Ectocarpus sp. CCAP 1310/34]|nr:unnamed protein product [Ectocarpus sp. CCAP 1310/34]